MWALSSAAGLSKSGPYSEAEIPSVATSRQAGTFQSLLALPSLLNGVSHYRGAFYSFCLLRRASPTPSLTPCRPSGPILERQARGEEGGTCWKSSTHEVSGCDLLLSRHSNSHLLSTHLQFWWHDLTCHLLEIICTWYLQQWGISQPMLSVILTTLTTTWGPICLKSPVARRLKGQLYRQRLNQIHVLKASLSNKNKSTALTEQKS